MADDMMISVRRRSVARHVRGTSDLLVAIVDNNLFHDIEPDFQFLDEKELAALETIRKNIDKVRKGMGTVARRLEK